MKKCLIPVVLMALLSCQPEYTPRIAAYYQQFDADDLSHLYSCPDTFVYTGHYQWFGDSLLFLYNSTDTVMGYTYTDFYSEDPLYWYAYREILYGRSRVEFYDRVGFEWAEVLLCKENHKDPADKIIAAKRQWIDFYFYEIFEYPETDSTVLDTATILGKTYHNVYKLYANEEDELLTGIREVFYTKKYGFIKLVSDRGRKLELLPAD